MTRSLRIAAALAVLLFAGAHLQAQDTSKQESRRDALRKEIAQLEQQIKVKTGQVLGRIDTIDGQTELHFEVWKEKEPENPELWLRKK